MERQKKKLKTAIIILAILLGVSVVALSSTLLYNYFIRSEQTSVEVPGNIITPNGERLKYTGYTGEVGFSAKPHTSELPKPFEPKPSAVQTTESSSVISTKASAISLHNKQPEDNTPFRMTNMFPGDSETKFFRIKVSYNGDIIVRYHSDIRPGYEKLAEVLKVRVTLPETDQLLYDGLMRDMPDSLNYAFYTNERTQSELYYAITAYLDTSVGNDYQDKELIADFRWWVEETEHLDAPQTGDTSNIYLWLCLVGGSLFCLILFLAKRRKEVADEV